MTARSDIRALILLGWLTALVSSATTKSALILPEGAVFGWTVRDASSDSVLEESSANHNFAPGSTLKLFTTWTALDMLGADRTFVTELLYNGTIVEGNLQGDLIIRGGGNPGFADARLGTPQGPAAVFSDWLLILQKFGITRVSGCVIGDGSYLLEEGPHPAMLWEDAGNYYAGTVSGLSFNGNIFIANFSGAPSPVTPVTLLGTRPNHTGIARFNNYLLTGPTDSEDSAYILGGFPSMVRDLRGTYPAGQMPFAIKGSLPNPAWTCAREFRDYLNANGIAVAPESAACGDSSALPNRSGTTGGVAISIARHTSPPLKELIRFTNQKSDNSYAAQFLALIGREGGQTGDWRGGLMVMNDYLAKRGFRSTELHLKDGNGLSRYNWVSPNQTAHLLVYASHQKAFPDFRASLVGVSETGDGSRSPEMRRKLERYGNDWDGRLWVKTGTLEGVSALAGYLKPRSGRLLAFAITVNNFEGTGYDMQKGFGPLLKEWAAKY